MTEKDPNYKKVPENHWILEANTEDLKTVLKRFGCETKNKNRAQLQKRILRLANEGLNSINDPKVVKASEYHLEKLESEKALKAKKLKKQVKTEIFEHKGTEKIKSESGIETEQVITGSSDTSGNQTTPAYVDALVPHTVPLIIFDNQSDKVSDDFTDFYDTLSKITDEGEPSDNLTKKGESGNTKEGETEGDTTKEGGTKGQVGSPEELEKLNRDIDQNLRSKSEGIYQNINTKPIDSETESEASEVEEDSFLELINRFNKLKDPAEGIKVVDPLTITSLKGPEQKVNMGETDEKAVVSPPPLPVRQGWDILARTVTFSNGDREDILEFLEAYNAEADVYGWNEAERIERLKTSLKNSALSSWLRSYKYKKNSGWEDVQRELRLLFRKNEDEVERELDQMEYKEGDNFHQYANKYENLAKQLKPDVTDLEIVKDLKQTLPGRMREYIATKDVKDKSGLLEAYTSWITYKKEAYDLNKHKKMMARLAAAEEELRKMKLERSGEGTFKNGEEDKVDKLINALYRGTFRPRNGVAGSSQPRQPYGGATNQKGMGPIPGSGGSGNRYNCYNCDGPGHFARDCWKSPGYKPQGTPARGNQAGSKPGPSCTSRKRFGSYHNKGRNTPSSNPKN